MPFTGRDRTAVIACSKEAKVYNVKNVMRVREAIFMQVKMMCVAQYFDYFLGLCTITYGLH
ncbi:hypothetical protein [Ochrobactrum sp. SFR4]|uniref:hypothetical protein n=1 Tax=Ochrobactrum sp. SFR4 TaxID=2717368 RepID=UPI00336A46FA